VSIADEEADRREAHRYNRREVRRIWTAFTVYALVAVALAIAAIVSSGALRIVLIVLAVVGALIAAWVGLFAVGGLLLSGAARRVRR
jgi:hypothetical protein